jgi:hypothetical protein
MCDETVTNTPTRNNYKDRQLLPPSQTWFRPSGLTYGLTPHTTLQDDAPQSSPDK